MATLTRAHLTEAVRKEIGLPDLDSADIVVSLLEAISERMSAGEPGNDILVRQLFRAR